METPTLNTVATPPTLAERIIQHIRMLELRVARVRAFLFGSGALASVVATIGALWYGTTVVLNSAFFQYLSLVLSDTGTLTSVWKELALSLLESFPVLETIGVFVAVYLVVLLTQHAARYGLMVSQLEKTA